MLGLLFFLTWVDALGRIVGTKYVNLDRCCMLIF
jgi:hypothetical protein